MKSSAKLCGINIIIGFILWLIMTKVYMTIEAVPIWFLIIVLVYCISTIVGLVWYFSDILRGKNEKNNNS